MGTGRGSLETRLAAVDAKQAWIMILGFVALGSGTLAIGLALPHAVRRGVSTGIGAMFVSLAGVGIIVAGPVRMDCSGELATCDARLKAGDVSWHNQATL